MLSGHSRTAAWPGSPGIGFRRSPPKTPASSGCFHAQSGAPGVVKHPQGYGDYDANNTVISSPASGDNAQIDTGVKHGHQ